MKSHTLALRSAAALACLMALPSLQAANVTDDFSVAVTGGPAGGSTAFGYFSYNSASVIAGGGSNSGSGLLTDPAFTPDGTSSTEATANTGSLGFNSLGGPSSFLIGTSCESAHLHPAQRRGARPGFVGADACGRAGGLRCAPSARLKSRLAQDLIEAASVERTGAPLMLGRPQWWLSRPICLALRYRCPALWCA